MANISGICVCIYKVKPEIDRNGSQGIGTTIVLLYEIASAIDGSAPRKVKKETSKDLIIYHSIIAETDYH